MSTPTSFVRFTNSRYSASRSSSLGTWSWNKSKQLMKILHTALPKMLPSKPRATEARIMHHTKTLSCQLYTSCISSDKAHPIRMFPELYSKVPCFLAMTKEKQKHTNNNCTHYCISPTAVVPKPCECYTTGVTNTRLQRQISPSKLVWNIFLKTIFHTENKKHWSFFPLYLRHITRKKRTIQLSSHSHLQSTSNQIYELLQK